jgi:hypothetical protein
MSRWGVLPYAIVYEGNGGLAWRQEGCTGLAEVPAPVVGALPVDDE